VKGSSQTKNTLTQPPSSDKTPPIVNMEVKSMAGRKRFVPTAGQLAAVEDLLHRDAQVWQICEFLGVSPITAKRAAIDGGLGPLWSERVRKGNRGRSIDPQRRARIADMVRRGATLQEIGTAEGVTRERIRQLLGDSADAGVRKVMRKSVERAKQLAKWRATARGALRYEFAAQLIERGYEIRINPVGCGQVFVDKVEARLVAPKTTWHQPGGAKGVYRFNAHLPDHPYFVALPTGHRYVYLPPILVGAMYFDEDGSARHYPPQESWTARPISE
jgi:hypothetical protein